eukprot:13453518-Ditylum_brightwellii.AAC.1
MKLLVHGTPLTSIYPNILSCISILNEKVEVGELPSTNFICGCHKYAQNLTATLDAYQLAKAKEWGQPFSDSTSWRQVALQNLVLTTIEKAGKMLGHWAKITKEMYPNFVHDIPDK